MTSRVLIVDDNASVQYALAELLAVLGGFQVLATLSGEMEATAWLHEHGNRVDIAVLDLLLMEGSGFNLIRRCKAESDACRVLIFSEFASPALEKRCRELGADAVFAKSQWRDLSEYMQAVQEASRR